VAGKAVLYSLMSRKANPSGASGRAIIDREDGVQKFERAVVNMFGRASSSGKGWGKRLERGGVGLECEICDLGVGRSERALGMACVNEMRRDCGGIGEVLKSYDRERNRWRYLGKS
jgi:hypothetical protein